MMGPRERVEWMMGIEEGTCWDEHWVLYVSDEYGNLLPKPRTHCRHCMLANLTINYIRKQTTKQKKKKLKKPIIDYIPYAAFFIP